MSLPGALGDGSSQRARRRCANAGSTSARAPNHADRRFPRKTTPSAQACISAPTACPDRRREVNALTYLYGYFTRLLAAGRREEGQTMAEYGVILAVITVAIIAVLVLLSDGIRNNLQAVVDALS
jgi:Flp pilus assembly pilin Flp